MLITCGKCGNDVSDKATRCPKCKTSLKPLSIACPECGKDLKEQDLFGDCPHCGYPLRHLRSSQPQIPPAQVPKAAAFECSNCGCVLPQTASSGGKCPNCGFLMRPERHAPQLQQTVRPAASSAPRGAFDAFRQKPRQERSPEYDPDISKIQPKAPSPKSRIRVAAEMLLWIMLVSSILTGGGYLILRNDLFGARSSLRSLSTGEETEDSINSKMADTRLWLKHVISVFVDQFPDSGSGAGETQGR